MFLCALVCLGGPSVCDECVCFLVYVCFVFVLCVIVCFGFCTMFLCDVCLFFGVFYVCFCTMIAFYCLFVFLCSAFFNSCVYRCDVNDCVLYVFR